MEPIKTIKTPEFYTKAKARTDLRCYDRVN